MRILLLVPNDVDGYTVLQICLFLQKQSEHWPNPIFVAPFQDTDDTTMEQKIEDISLLITNSQHFLVLQSPGLKQDKIAHSFMRKLLAYSEEYPEHKLILLKMVPEKTGENFIDGKTAIKLYTELEGEEKQTFIAEEMQKLLNILQGKRSKPIIEPGFPGSQ